MTRLQAWWRGGRPWRQRHPVWTVLIALFALGVFVRLWFLLTPLAIVLAVLYVWRRRTAAQARERARLRAAADAAFWSPDPAWVWGGVTLPNLPVPPPPSPYAAPTRRYRRV